MHRGGVRGGSMSEMRRDVLVGVSHPASGMRCGLVRADRPASVRCSEQTQLGLLWA